MLIDFSSEAGRSPMQIEEDADHAEAAGYDGFAALETTHDVFTSLALAARASKTIALQSAVAVAFARNPMSVATAANDLQLISQGRFHLGLGSQVRVHIERRFAMSWGQPTARMEEFIAAVRAIWACWATGEGLNFRGDFYNHTIMTDFFDPGPNPHGNPPILLGAVGERMTEIAGRIADGFLCHTFTTESYLRELTLPALTRTRGSLEGFSICLPALVVLGNTADERAKAAAAMRRQIAFFGSTPAYRPVLEHHGWGALHDKLNSIVGERTWTEMGNLISDEVLDTFAVYGTAPEVAGALRERFGDIASRISLFTPYPVDQTQALAVAQHLRSGELPGERPR